MNIYEKPATRFVADFIGETNFLSGVIEAVEPGRVRVTVAGQPWLVFSKGDGRYQILAPLGVALLSVVDARDGNAGSATGSTASKPSPPKRPRRSKNASPSARCYVAPSP